MTVEGHEARELPVQEKEQGRKDHACQRSALSRSTRAPGSEDAPEQEERQEPEDDEREPRTGLRQYDEGGKLGVR
jgi:hypothetical protein